MEYRRIVLIGYRGTGKSSIGKNIAEILNLPHHDTDTLIEEREGKPVHEIFRNRGEAAFRDIESDIIHGLPVSPVVISTGGGVVLRQENIRRLRKNSQMILLTSSEEEIAARTQATLRPSLTGLSLRDEIHTVLEERLPAYRSAADFTFDTSGKKPREAASEILRSIRPGARMKEDMLNRRALCTKVLGTPVPESSRGPTIQAFADPSVRIYGILGNPCMHSLSPPIWNRLFHALGMPARYCWFEFDDVDQFFSAAERSGVRGISVTIPYKERIIPHLDEIRHDARTIGAVNTVLFLGGKRYGYNTDWKGIYRPLEGVTGETAVILGAGGAAAAAVYAAEMRGFSPVILNRTRERAADLARRTGARYGTPDEFSQYDADLVINATPVGMAGTRERSGLSSPMPVPASCLHPDMHVFDLVYTPAETPFLRAALEKGCSVIPGTEMFIHQLAEQFITLTGIDVPVDKIRRWLL